MLKSTLTRLREARMREFEGAEAVDAGFTLIELMVVLLIIAILLAIAIPTFLGVTGSANDRAAQSNITNALTEAKALYQNSQTYCEASCAQGSLPLATVQASAPEFTWSNANVAPGNNISILPVDVTTTAGTGDGLIMAAMSKNANTCWYAVDLESAPNPAFVDTAPNLDFAQAGTAAGPGQWEAPVGGTAQKITAGVFYAKSTIGGAAPNPSAATGCVATSPITIGTASVWNWGTTFSNAPSL